MRRTRAQKILTAITFLNVLAAMGCGNYSPVSPSQDNTTMPGVESPQFVTLAASGGSEREMLRESVVSKLILAEEGGEITNGYFSVYFPPGALASDTEIKMSLPFFPSAIIELEPHGIQFMKEVILSLPMTVIEENEASLKVLWYNDNVNYWEEINGYYEGGTYKAKLMHFSEYGYSHLSL